MDDTNNIITGEEITGKTEDSKSDNSDLPIFDAEIMRYVRNVIAPSLANKFHQDRDDVEQDLWLKLLMSARSLPIIESPKSFYFVTARNNCLNHERRSQLELRHLETLKTKDIHSTRKSAGGGTVAVHCATASSPEDEFFKSELRKKILKILKSLPPEKARLLRLFLAGKSPKEIAEQTNTPLKTVYGVLKRIQKEIIKELGLEETLAREPELEVVLVDLIISSLGESINPGSSSTSP
jgi:RNA polymerase sigma factor (sigma-70 family)